MGTNRNIAQAELELRTAELDQIHEALNRCFECVKALMLTGAEVATTMVPHVKMLSTVRQHHLPRALHVKDGQAYLLYIQGIATKASSMRLRAVKTWTRMESGELQEAYQMLDDAYRAVCEACGAARLAAYRRLPEEVKRLGEDLDRLVKIYGMASDPEPTVPPGTTLN